MPRSGGGVYTLPAGSLVTDGVDDILATQHNTPLQDIATDMNTPRPIVAGGTGAATAADARTNLGATATGSALFTAATAADGRTSLGVLSTLSNPLNLDVGGFIIKSGDGVTSGIGIQNVVFNTAFPNALIGVSVTPITTAATCGSADSPTSTGFQARTFFSTSGSFTPSGYRWIAIGW